MHPVRAGFQAIRRQPAVIAGEIAWRWSFGIAAWVLIVLTLHGIFRGVDISEPEYLLSRQSDLFLIADACARLLYQVLPAFIRAAAVLTPALALLWVIAATFGRAATLKALSASGEVIESTCVYSRRSLGPLVALNLLRAIFTLATLLALIATTILIGRIIPPTTPPVAFAFAWLCFAALVALCWSIVNWFLSLAPIFVVRDGHEPLQSISDSLALYRHRPSAYVSTAFWFGIFRAIAFACAFILAVFAAAAAGSPAAAILISIVIALAYFAVADYFYITRLAAFIALDSAPPVSPAATPCPEPAIPTVPLA